MSLLICINPNVSLFVFIFYVLYVYMFVTYTLLLVTDGFLLSIFMLLYVFVLFVFRFLYSFFSFFVFVFFFFKQKTAYEMRISDWSSDVCSSDLGGAQDVERGVITLGDIAALGGIDRRRRDQRAREEIDQRAMARQRRKKLDKKRWTLGLARQLVVEAARFVEAVAHLAKIARAPPARCEPTQSAADEIGRAHV